MRALDVVTSSLASGARLGAGLIARRDGRKRPEQDLVLYEFEACPFCRKVRDALTTLDLEAEIRPCPKNGTRFRPIARELGGATKFPLLVDPNQDLVLPESNDIVRHLSKTYGSGTVPLGVRMGPLTDLSSMLTSAFRPTRGARARPSIAPEKRLELWSFEASPYCRLVREVLCELEIPYLLHNVGKRSPSRKAFVERSGKMMVPYLADPNTGQEMFESAEIVDYLNDTYGL